MAEVEKFSSKDIKGWLEKETSSIFVPVHAKAQKLADELRKALESLADASKMLLDNSAKEIEKRNMKTYGRARALNKLARLFLDRIRQVKAPEKVSFESLQEFAKETQKALLVTEVDIRNWFPRISPFFILDRRKFLVVFEKAKETLKDVSDFLTKEYIKTKTLEETFQLIDKLHAFETQLADLMAKSEKIEAERASIEREIAETRRKMDDLKSKGGISQLTQIDSEIEALSAEVKQSLQHLQKPFIKLQSLTLHGGGSGLTPEEVKKLSDYLENPFEALATEGNGYPLLVQILRKLDRAMSEDKLKLKADKMRKAKQTIENILEKNSLASLHQKCVDVLKRKNQLSASIEIAETKSYLQGFQGHLENLERKIKSLEFEENALKNAYKETSEKIQSHKTQIEKNIFSFLGRKVRIE